MENKKFDENVVKNIEKLSELNNYGQENIEEYYDKVATAYEDTMITMGHPDPHHCGEAAVELITGAGKAVADAKCLDMGCGTGLVGVELHKRGFPDIVGVDASEGMLESAKEKNAYTELQHLFLGKPDTYP